MSAPQPHCDPALQDSRVPGGAAHVSAERRGLSRWANGSTSRVSHSPRLRLESQDPPETPGTGLQLTDRREQELCMGRLATNIALCVRGCASMGEREVRGRGAGMRDPD